MNTLIYLSLLVIGRVLAQSNATTADTSLPNCVPLCIQCKLNEAKTLAPNCDTNDLSCLCSTNDYTRAYNKCLWDNCANANQVETGQNIYAQICSNAGIAMSTYVAATNGAAKQSAVAQVASLLGEPVSGSVAVPTPAFHTESAYAVASSYQASQQAIATASAIAAYSEEVEQASMSLNREANLLSASIAKAEQQASLTELMLRTQLDSSQFAQAQSMIDQTLSMMRVAASTKLAGDAAAASASLASASQSLLGPAQTGVVNAKSSYSQRTQVQAGLGLISVIGALFLL